MLQAFDFDLDRAIDGMVTGNTRSMYNHYQIDVMNVKHFYFSPFSFCFVFYREPSFGAIAC